MKRTTAVFLSAALLLSAGGCDAGNPAPEPSEETETSRTNPGEFLTERELSLAVGDREFPLSASYTEVTELFGEDLVFPFGDEEKVDRGTRVSGSLYCGEKYFGVLSFSFDPDDPNGSGRFESAVMEFPLGEELYGSAFRRAEDGRVTAEDVLLEPEALSVRFGGFSTGVSTRAELHKSFGNGIERERYEGYISDEYIFEDAVLRLVYGRDEIFLGLSVVLT